MATPYPITVTAAQVLKKLFLLSVFFFFLVVPLKSCDFCFQVNSGNEEQTKYGFLLFFVGVFFRQEHILWDSIIRYFNSSQTSCTSFIVMPVPWFVWMAITEKLPLQYWQFCFLILLNCFSSLSSLLVIFNKTK